MRCREDMTAFTQMRNWLFRPQKADHLPQQYFVAGEFAAVVETRVLLMVGALLVNLQPLLCERFSGRSDTGHLSPDRTTQPKADQGQSRFASKTPARRQSPEWTTLSQKFSAPTTGHGV